MLHPMCRAGGRDRHARRPAASRRVPRHVRDVHPSARRRRSPALVAPPPLQPPHPLPPPPPAVTALRRPQALQARPAPLPQPPQQLQQLTTQRRSPCCSSISSTSRGTRRCARGSRSSWRACSNPRGRTGQCRCPMAQFTLSKSSCGAFWTLATLCWWRSTRSAKCWTASSRPAASSP